MPHCRGCHTIQTSRSCCLSAVVQNKPGCEKDCPTAEKYCADVYHSSWMWQRNVAPLIIPHWRCPIVPGGPVCCSGWADVLPGWTGQKHVSALSWVLYRKVQTRFPRMHRSLYRFIKHKIFPLSRYGTGCFLLRNTGLKVIFVSLCSLNPTLKG